MEDLVQMQEDLRTGLIASKRTKLEKKFIGVEFERIGGLSNTNFIGIVKDLTTNEKVFKVIFRTFGALSDCVDHDLEANLMDYLAKKGIGPSLYYEDPNEKFRITEFLEGTSNIEREKGLEPMTIKKICQILNLYNLYSYSYKYAKEGDRVSLTRINDGIKTQRREISKNQYENCMIDCINQGQKVFKKFVEQFQKKFERGTHHKEYQDMLFIKHYADNFKEYFSKTYPDQGFFVMCHNDIHRLNFLLRKKDQKLFIIDHEYAFLNLPGVDMANYLNETYFNYEPKYFCTLDKVNFDKTYPYYKEYITQFVNSHKFFENEEGGEEFLKYIQTKKYFIGLHNIVNLFWFVWSINYIDFSNWEKDHVGEYYFVHAIDRLKLYLAGVRAMEKCTN